MTQIKILVIDDDEDTTDLLELFLSPATSTVLVAHSGKDGIELAKKHSPDLIILDLLMPVMTGWQVCKAVREFSEAPILILSAVDSPDIIAQALDLGADDYLIKPVSSSSLIARLNKLMRRPRLNISTGALANRTS